MAKPRVWVLTGGIGSGKSTVGRLLRNLGADVIDADSIGHDILAPGGMAVGPVAERWPEAVIDGVIDRRLLAAIVFSNPEKLAELESVTHAHIRSEVDRRIRSSRATMVFVDASVPKLISHLWPVVVVDAPTESRLERLLERGLTPSDARLRMVSQADRSGWLALADHVVDNSGSRAELERSVVAFARAIGLAN